MFDATLTLAQNRREAQALAETLESVARALREWDVPAWEAAAERAVTEESSHFERLIQQVATKELDARGRTQAVRSAEAVTGVLRVLWPSAADLPQIEEPRQPALQTAG
jgi:hypothetical protein